VNLEVYLKVQSLARLRNITNNLDSNNAAEMQSCIPLKYKHSVLLPYQHACSVFFLSVSHCALLIEYMHFNFMFQISKHLIICALFESLN
jgi:hypothetical protein